MIWKWYKIDNENGVAKIFASLNDSIYNLNGKIIFANISFKAVGNVESSSLLHLEINGYDGNPYPTVTDGIFKILPTLRLIPSNACIPLNSSYSFNITIDELPSGLAGYNITVGWLSNPPCFCLPP